MRLADLPAKQTKRYIKTLQDFPPHRQLLIKVGGGLLQDKAAVEELVEAVAELAQHDIHTLIVHGGGPQINAALKQYAVEPHFIDGKRYTDEATLKLAKATFDTLSKELAQAFGEAGLQTAMKPAQELFAATRDPKFGLVGTHITSLDAETIKQELGMHPVMVVQPLTRDDKTGETLNINADTVFRALAMELKPHRMVSLTPTGGVLKPIAGSDSHELISGINIRDIDSLIEDGIVSGGMALKLRELATILEKLEVGSAISITKPAELLQELLTDEGSGTFICKGQKIVSSDDVDGLLPDIIKLIEEVFEKSLPDGYENQPFRKLYFTGDHLAFGIITELSDGTPYLDKLAVSPQLQGRGVGESLWYRIAKDYPELAWRSHVNNRYSTWYHRHADVMKRSGEWILFARGLGFPRLEALEEEIVHIPQMRYTGGHESKT
jgi:acetylglutamate kinase